MKLAMNEATTMNASFEDDVAAYSAAGFDAIELWLDKVKTYLENHTLDDAKKLLSDNGLKSVCACYHLGVMLSEGEERQKTLDEFRGKLEMCQVLGAPIIIVPSDLPERDIVAADYEKAVGGLGEAADIAKEYGISLAIEFLQFTKFIQTLKSALNLIRKTGRENVGLLIDTFHLYVGRTKVEDILLAKAGEIKFVHINDMNDVPLEIAQDADRIFLGEGILPLKQIFANIKSTGYDGYYSLELFNEKVWEMDIREAAKIAYETSKAFFDELNLN